MKTQKAKLKKLHGKDKNAVLKGKAKVAAKK